MRAAHLVLGWLVLAACAPTALAQFGVRTELEISSDAAIVSHGALHPPVVGLTVRAHVEATWDAGPIEVRATLDPVARASGTSPPRATFEAGLTDALLAVPLEGAELRIGLLQHPVQTARLSAPVRLEATNGAGMPEGLLGAAATVYLDAWRLRPAALFRVRDGVWIGGASVRRDAGVFDLEGHFYWLDGLAVGAGGSGLVGDTVVYGEAWLRSSPWGFRGAAGASGFAGAGLWTLEAAYAPLGSGLGAPQPQLHGQVDVPLEADAGIAVDARLAWASANPPAPAGSELRYGASVRLYHADPDAIASISASIDHAEAATRYGVRISLTTYR